MKFASILFASGAAAGLIARQADQFTQALNDITEATTALQAGIQSYSGEADTESLQGLADAVVAAINNGETLVGPIEPLTSNEAFALAGPLGELVTLVTDTVDATVAQDRIDVFTAAGAVPTVLDTLNAIRDATSSFSDVALTKVPAGQLQDIANEAIGSITTALDQAIEVYSGIDGGPTDPTDTATEPEPTATGEPEPTVTDTPPVYGTTTAEPPVYETSAPSVGTSAPSYDTASPPPYATTEAPKPTTYEPVSPTTTPAPYNPNGAASNAAGMGAVAVAALAAIAAF